MAYDVVVIGSGPGGYVCAIKAAQLGLKVAVVETRATYGGTCLNIGCIPSKALLHATEIFAEADHGLEALGVEVGKPKLNLKKMMEHKDATVASNVNGVAFLFKKNKIDGIQGTGRIVSAGKVAVAARRRRHTGTRNQGDRDRHRLGCRRDTRRQGRYRREGDHLVDGRAGT